MQQPRADNGQYISLEKFVMSLMDERLGGLRREIAKDQKALELQAKEYERRLDALNHAHERALAVQHTFVSVDKYEDKMEAEESARAFALERLDEQIASLDKQINDKLDDYITKAEQREAERDQAIALQEGAAQEAQRAAETQGRESKAHAEAQHRKTNRNMALAGLVLTVIIAVSNYL